MIPVHAIVPGALAAVIRKAPLSEEKVAFAWRTAVGAAVAGASEATLDAGVLRVRARDRAWQREIERSAAVIRGRLDDLLGAAVVRYIDVTVAAAAPESRLPAPAVPPARGSAAAARVPKSSPSAGGSGNARRRR